MKEEKWLKRERNRKITRVDHMTSNTYLHLSWAEFKSEVSKLSQTSITDQTVINRSSSSQNFPSREPITRFSSAWSWKASLWPGEPTRNVHISKRNHTTTNRISARFNCTTKYKTTHTKYKTMRSKWKTWRDGRRIARCSSELPNACTNENLETWWMNSRNRSVKHGTDYRHTS